MSEQTGPYRIVRRESPETMVLDYVVEPPIPMYDHGIVNLEVDRGLCAGGESELAADDPGLLRATQYHAVRVRNRDGASHVTVDFLEAFRGNRGGYYFSQSVIQKFAGNVVHEVIDELNTRELAVAPVDL